MIGSGWVNDELGSEVETVAGVVVTDSSDVGNKLVPFALTGGADETTALSVVGNSAGELGDGGGGAEVSAVCASEFCGRVGALELFFSVAAVCCSFTCCCNVCTISLSDWTCSRNAWTSAVVAGVEAAGRCANSDRYPNKYLHLFS